MMKTIQFSSFIVYCYSVSQESPGLIATGGDGSGSGTSGPLGTGGMLRRGWISFPRGGLGAWGRYGTITSSVGWGGRSVLGSDPCGGGFLLGMRLFFIS